MSATIDTTDGRPIQIDDDTELVAIPKSEWKDMQDRLDSQAERIDELEGELENQSQNVTGAFTKIGEIDERITELEESENTQPADTNENPTPTHESPETSLETVVSLPEELAQQELTANQQRARFVATDITDYGQSVPAGIRIDSGDMRRVLNAASDDGQEMYRTTVKRVMEFLDRFGGNETTVKRSHGKRFVVFSDDLVDRIQHQNRTDVCYGQDGMGW